MKETPSQYCPSLPASRAAAAELAGERREEGSGAARQ